MQRCEPYHIYSDFAELLEIIRYLSAGVFWLFARRVGFGHGILVGPRVLPSSCFSFCVVQALVCSLSFIHQNSSKLPVPQGSHICF